MMNFQPAPTESRALKSKMLLVWATLTGATSKKEIIQIAGIRALTWVRWTSGLHDPPQPRRYDLAGKLLSGNAQPWMERRISFPNPQRKAWEDLIELLSERSETQIPKILQLLKARGEFVRGAPNSELVWRVFEMSLWVAAGVRLENFSALDWKARIPMLNVRARAEIRRNEFLGFFNVNAPFDIVGRPAQMTGLARIRMQASQTGDIETPNGKRRRPGT